MIYEEYELYEQGDKVKVHTKEYNGINGVVAEDQIDRDFYVIIKLVNKDMVTVCPNDLEYLGQEV